MRKIVYGALAVAFLIFLVETLFLWDQASGRRRWEKWKASREAMGDAYTWGKLVPPPVPDDQNFAMAPILADAIIGKAINPALKPAGDFKSADPLGDWKVGRPEQRTGWGPAGNADEELKPYNEGLDTVVEASRRPQSRLPIDYEHYEVPGLLGMRFATRLLRLRAITRMDRGDTEGALEDTLACLRVEEHFAKEPVFIATLLRTALVGISMQAVWEGLNTHKWDEDQLARLQEALARIDLLPGERLGFEGERMFVEAMFLSYAEGVPPPSVRTEHGKELKPMDRTDFPLFIRGWAYWNLLEYDRFYSTCYLDSIDPAKHRFLPALADQERDWFTGKGTTPHNLLAKRFALGLFGQVPRLARDQAGVDEASVVCGLERFRLASGRYPEALTELLPRFMDRLPNDVISGGLMHYQRVGEGFRLYEVGWDGKDDGGKVVYSTGDTKTQDVTKGDWPWLPATE